MFRSIFKYLSPVLIAISINANAGDNNEFLELGIFISYAEKSGLLDSQDSSVKKIENILEKNYLSKNKISEEPIEVLRDYYKTVATLVSHGKVVSAKYMMESINNIAPVDINSAGHYLKRLTDGALDYSDDELSESDDESLVIAYKLIEKYKYPYEKKFSKSSVEYRYAEMMIMGGAYQDEIAISTAYAMIYSMGNKELAIELKSRAMDVNREVTVLTGIY